MKRIYTTETINNIDKEVLLKGWVNTKRDHGKITFIDLKDREGIVQIVGSGEEIRSLHPEDVIELKGTVKLRPEKLVNPKIETGKVEIEAKAITLIANAKEIPFDIGKEDLDVSLPVLLDYRPLTLHHNKIKAVFKVQAEIAKGYRQASEEQGCTEIFVPTISASATEGGAEVFRVNYYGHNAYLTQSPQLYKQVMVGSLERVFTLSHAYRAEPSVTTRHLSEVVQMDCEVGFIESFNELLDIVEYLGTKTIEYAVENSIRELKLLNAEKPLIPKNVPRLKMREAQEIIKKRTGRDVTKEPDLGPEDEQEICRWAKEEFKSDFVTITHYPTKKRAFYTYPDPENPEFSLSFDVLFRGLEVCSGSRRINDYEELVQAIKTRGMNPDNFEMYLMAFKYGMPPEGGFSYGLERLTMKLLNLDNVREASIFPRDMERVDMRLNKIEDEGIKPYDKIMTNLVTKGVAYKHFAHEPVTTSEESAHIRGTNIHQGAKALFMQADKDYILFVLPADLKADLDSLQQFLKVKKLALASKDTIKAKTGLDVGAIPPFGSVLGVKTYVDSHLSENKEIAFNAGRLDRSILMNYEDYISLEKPILVP
jgi:nondiscriminating aspartyl-tRNA synthetase